MSRLRWGHVFSGGVIFIFIVFEIFVKRDNGLAILLRFVDPTVSGEGQYGLHWKRE